MTTRTALHEYLTHDLKLTCDAPPSFVLRVGCASAPLTMEMRPGEEVRTVATLTVEQRGSTKRELKVQMPMWPLGDFGEVLRALEGAAAEEVQAKVAELTRLQELHAALAPAPVPAPMPAAGVEEMPLPWVEEAPATEELSDPPQGSIEHTAKQILRVLWAEPRGVRTLFAALSTGSTDPAQATEALEALSRGGFVSTPRAGEWVATEAGRRAIGEAMTARALWAACQVVSDAVVRRVYEVLYLTMHHGVSFVASQAELPESVALEALMEAEAREWAVCSSEGQAWCRSDKAFERPNPIEESTPVPSSAPAVPTEGSVTLDDAERAWSVLYRLHTTDRTVASLCAVLALGSETVNAALYRLARSGFAWGDGGAWRRTPEGGVFVCSILDRSREELWAAPHLKPLLEGVSPTVVSAVSEQLTVWKPLGAADIARNLRIPEGVVSEVLSALEAAHRAERVKQADGAPPSWGPDRWIAVEYGEGELQIPAEVYAALRSPGHTTAAPVVSAPVAEAPAPTPEEVAMTVLQHLDRVEGRSVAALGVHAGVSVAFVLSAVNALARRGFARYDAAHEVWTLTREGDRFRTEKTLGASLARELLGVHSSVVAQVFDDLSPTVGRTVRELARVTGIPAVVVSQALRILESSGRAAKTGWVEGAGSIQDPLWLATRADRDEDSTDADTEVVSPVAEAPATPPAPTLAEVGLAILDRLDRADGKAVVTLGEYAKASEAVVMEALLAFARRGFVQYHATHEVWMLTREGVRFRATYPSAEALAKEMGSDVHPMVVEAAAEHLSNSTGCTAGTIARQEHLPTAVVWQALCSLETANRAYKTRRGESDRPNPPALWWSATPRGVSAAAEVAYRVLHRLDPSVEKSEALLAREVGTPDVGEALKALARIDFAEYIADTTGWRLLPAGAAFIIERKGTAAMLESELTPMRLRVVRRVCSLLGGVSATARDAHSVSRSAHLTVELTREALEVAKAAGWARTVGGLEGVGAPWVRTSVSMAEFAGYRE